MSRKQYLTADDIAERFKVSTRTVYLWVDRGLLPPIRVGPRLVRFTEEGIQRFLRASEPGVS